MNIIQVLSFVQGAVVFHFWQSMDFRGFEFHFLVHVCRDKCTVVRIGSILVPRSILLCISSIKCNLETISREIHKEDCKTLFFINQSIVYCLKALTSDLQALRVGPTFNTDYLCLSVACITVSRVMLHILTLFMMKC